MLQKLRWQLTLWFVGLSFLLYVALTAAALGVFDHGLNQVLDQELHGLQREIRPDIEYIEHQPSLRRWAQLASARQIQLLATIQLYDKDGKLLEEYGPEGIPGVSVGATSTAQHDAFVRSWHRKLVENGQPVGFVQLQISTKQKDSAVKQLLYTLAVLAPLLLLGLGLIGYIFAGKALKPTEESMGVLRRFLADAGHELNTPITIIQASIETLEEKKVLDSNDNIFNAVTRATNRLSDLGKKLMLLAKIESPESISGWETFDFDALIKLTCEDLAPACEAKAVKLTFGDFPSIQTEANSEAIRTMASNLIDNALTYTESGGTIKVSLEERNGIIVLIVEDTGIGIPAESLPRIFERFYRVDKSRSRAVGGSGLGLAIVKAIVEAHRGTVRVESVIGHGTKFIVQIPIKYS
jgi:signal transduction histidine kinase